MPPFFETLYLYLVDVAPTEAVFGFVAAYEGVFGFVEVGGSVFVFGVVAAADMAAGEAEAQRYPLVAFYQAFGATAGGFGADVWFDLA